MVHHCLLGPSAGAIKQLAQFCLINSIRAHDAADHRVGKKILNGRLREKFALAGHCAQSPFLLLGTVDASLSGIAPLWMSCLILRREEHIGMHVLTSQPTRKCKFHR